MGIVPCTLLGVRKDLVCRLNLGEQPSGLLDVPIVSVRVQFQRFSSVCFFDPRGKCKLSRLWRINWRMEEKRLTHHRLPPE
jgi:hypothetical protein